MAVSVARLSVCPQATAHETRTWHFATKFWFRVVRFILRVTLLKMIKHFRRPCWVLKTHKNSVIRVSVSFRITLRANTHMQSAINTKRKDVSIHRFPSIPVHNTKLISLEDANVLDKRSSPVNVNFFWSHPQRCYLTPCSTPMFQNTSSHVCCWHECLSIHHDFLYNFSLKHSQF